MKAFCWLSICLMLVITGCATTEKRKIEEATQIRKLAEAYLAEKKYVPAYQELQRALQMNPNDAHLHYDLGIFYFEKKKYDTAIEEYDKSLTLKPDFASARNNLGVVYMEIKEWDKAIEILTPLTEDYLYATPHYPQLLIGQAYFYKEDYPSALNHFQSCQDLKPDFPFAAHWIGKTYLEMKKPEKAIHALEQAVKLEPDAPVFLFDLGRAYCAAGQFKKAEESFEKAAMLSSDEDMKTDSLEQLRLVRKKIYTK